MSGFTNMVGSLYIFVVVKTYPAMSAAMTTAGAYWFYASIRFRNVATIQYETSKKSRASNYSGVLSVSFGIFLMPETKGKHFEDIADDFAKRTAEKGEEEDGESAGAMLGGGGGVMRVESAAAEYERRSSLAC